jgi:drug/metabolite transporter (DMT)-like permease
LVRKQPLFHRGQALNSINKRKQAELLLILVTFIWGSTFVVVKQALKDISPLPFIALRFLAAAVLLFFVFLARGRLDRKAILPGSILGLFLFLGYMFQTSGLVYTTPAKSAFITGSSVILVPTLLLFGTSRPRASNFIGGFLGLAGLYCMVMPRGMSSINRGDVLTVFGAIAFAVQIVLVGHYTRRFSFVHLVPVQILMVGLLALLAWPFDPGSRLHWTQGLMAAFAITAVLATAFAFSVQNWAQQYTPASHTALIFALEPVFATLTSWWVVKQRLEGRAFLGAGLIFAGMLVAELWGGGAPSPVEG